MGRVKGCVVSKDILPAEHCGDVDGLHYVEEIPKNAIRGETVVKYDAWSETLQREVRPILHLPDFPAHLIGKKVSFIIIPEEDQ